MLKFTEISTPATIQSMEYRKRFIEDTVKKFLDLFPVVGITGPRQSGKSTLLRYLLKGYEYVTFDDAQMVKLYQEDPVGFMKRYCKKVIFDEVQLVPEIFSSIKILVDNDRQNYGNFVLTGSSQFSFLKSASESLAGRIGLVSLLPFQYGELPKEHQKEAVYRGSYPELVLRDYKGSNFWYSSYLNTYLNKDLRTLANIGDIRDFTRFIYLLASQVGQTLDMSHYAKDIGISVPTIKRWISILEASYILFLVPPYFKNYGKRIVKSPKVYFFDTGLVSYLTGIETFKQYDLGPLAGALFENYVVSEIYKKELHSASDAQLYFLRTYDQKEIDLIVGRKSSNDLIEIKKNATLKPAMIKTLVELKKKEDRAFLLYQGESNHIHDVEIMHFQKYLDI